MSKNAVAARGASTAIAALSSLKAGLQNVSTTMKVTTTDPFLRLLGNGSWVYGAENIEVEEGSRWAVNPMSLMHGWVAWTDRPGKQSNEIVGEVMVPMTSPLPALHDLPKIEDISKPEDKAEWRQQLSLQIACITGEDKGEQTLYKTTSVGGMGAMKKVISAIMAQLDEDPEHPVPVVLLESDSYQHKKWGLTYTPVFSIVDWASMDGVVFEDLEEEEDAGEEPEAEEAEEAEEAGGTQAFSEEEMAAARRAALEAELEALKAPKAKAEAKPAETKAAPADGAVRRRRR